MERTKIKELHLRYNVMDFRKMRKIKDERQMSWEDFVFYAIMNVRVKNGKRI